MNNISSFMTSVIPSYIIDEVIEIFENTSDIFDVKIIKLNDRKKGGFICGKISTERFIGSDYLNYKTFGYINNVLSRGPNDKINISVHNEDGSTVIFKLKYCYVFEVTVYDNNLIGVTDSN